MVGQIMQDYGITVIPTLQWCKENTYPFAFDGIERGGTVSVSTIGVKQDDDARDIWVPEWMKQPAIRAKEHHRIWW